MEHLQADDGPSPFNIFIILSVIVVAVAMLVFAGLAIMRVSGVGDSATSREHGPYGISARPIPVALQAKDLLPEKFGDFKRGPITGKISDFKTTYTKGDLQISLAGSSAVNLRAAQASVSDVARAVGAGKNVQRQLDQDPSYYIINDAGLVRFAWSHGYWFFDVTANSQQALDEFMREFPY